MKPSHKTTASHTRKTTANTHFGHHKARPTCQETSRSTRSIDIRNLLIINEMAFRLIDTSETIEIAVTG